MDIQTVIFTSLITFLTGWFLGRYVSASKKEVTITATKPVEKSAEEPEPQAIAPVKPSDLQALIASRRSMFPKDYTGAIVPDEVINAMFQAANWAPTHGKTEPWRFVVLPKEVIPHVYAIKRAHFQRTMKGPKLEKVMAKMARKEKDAKRISHLIMICSKKVKRMNGAYMPEWEEVAAVSCAVQNMHLMLSLYPPYCGYWSSGGVGKGGWLENKEMRALAGMNDQGCQDSDCDMCAMGAPAGECRADRILGLFHLGASDNIDQMKARRKKVSDKVTWINSLQDLPGSQPTPGATEEQKEHDQEQKEA